MSKPYMKVESDFTKQFNEVIKKFRSDKVLVGIPEDTDDRKTEVADGPLGNAALLAINEFGSPMNNIPPRPVMAIGIRNAQEEIAEQFKICAQSVLTAVIKGGSALSAIDNHYQRAGIIASTSVKKAINSQEGIDGPAESTLSSRRSRGFKGVKALIVTGQMRNAITYVLRGG